jgi:hypothetical protein
LSFKNENTMDTLRRANLLEVVNRVQQKVSATNLPEESSPEVQSPVGVESPIDYSMMNRKRRLLQMSPDHGSTKKTLDYGSDGQSDDRSSSGSPVETNPDSGIVSPNESKYMGSSPAMESPTRDDELDQHPHNIHHHPRLQEIPNMHHHAQQQQHKHAAALQLFLQAQHHQQQQQQQQHQHQQQQQQHQQQHAELLPPFLRMLALGQHTPPPNMRWAENISAISPPPALAPPTTPSSTTAATLELARATHESQQKFAEFRETLLRQIESSRNPKMMRRSSSPSPPISPSPTCDAMDSATPSTNGDKDNAYWERRRKNNEAAKRSRDARRAKEQEIALRAQFLEQENIQLKLEVAHLRAENAQLRGQFQQHLHLSAAGKN